MKSSKYLPAPAPPDWGIDLDKQNSTGYKDLLESYYLFVILNNELTKSNKSLIFICKSINL